GRNEAPPPRGRALLPRSGLVLLQGPRLQPAPRSDGGQLAFDAGADGGGGNRGDADSRNGPAGRDEIGPGCRRPAGRATSETRDRHGLATVEPARTPAGADCCSAYRKPAAF